MTEYNHLANAVMGTEGKAEYDSRVKELLSDKQILAWIMKYTMKEFKGMTALEIISCIEGEPEISIVPVSPGLTKEVISGSRNESSIPNEGLVFYDIRFYAVTPDKEKVKILVNLEAQKDYYPGYDLVTRALFYCARMMSAQLDTEFTPKNYDDIKKVYSIWICMESPAYAERTITEYSISPRSLYGELKGKARYDLLSAVMICLGRREEKETENDFQGSRLHGMLETLLSNKMTAKEKLHSLKENYGMHITRKMDEEVHSMCNLSDGIEEKGIVKGKLDSLKSLMSSMQWSFEQACQALRLSEEDVKMIKNQM